MKALKKVLAMKTNVLAGLNVWVLEGGKYQQIPSKLCKFERINDEDVVIIEWEFGKKYYDINTCQITDGKNFSSLMKQYNAKVTI